MTTTVEAVQQTLAEYERLARDTGEWNGAEPPEFSNDGERWAMAWLPDAENDHPALARVRIFRREDTRPTTVVVRWDEALPADEDWRALWLRKPTTLFGAFTYRTGLRRAFRDVIGDRREPDELDAPTAPTPAAAPRDFAAELETTKTPEDVQQLHAAAKKARAVTVPLETAIRRRLSELTAAPEVAAPPMPAVAVMPAPKPGNVKQPTPRLPSPADLARIAASRPVEQPQRSKNGRRPQRQKPRGPRA